MKKTIKLLSVAFVLTVILAFSCVWALAVDIPERPAAINVKSDFTSITLSWDAVENAKGYRVYQSVNGKWKILKTSTAKSYTVTGLKANTTYRFAVKPYAKVDGVTYWAKSYTTVNGKTLSAPASPAKINVSADFTSITLSWNATKNATGYRVYQSVNGKWKALKTTTAKKYTVTGLTDTTDYKFAVKAYAKKDGVTYWASAYTKVSARTLGAPDKPAKVTAKKNSSAVILSWDKCLNATGYKIYQSVSGKWKSIGYASTTSYAVSKLSANTTYKFAVKPYIKADGKTYYAKSYTTVSVTTEKANVLSVYTNGIYEDWVDLRWKKSSSANGYAVYQKVNGEWKLLKEETKNSTSYYVNDLEVASTYEFAVRSFMKHGGKVYWSDYSAITVTTDPLRKPDAPRIKSVKADTVSIYWHDHLKATGSRIYIKEKGGSWKTVKDVRNGTEKYDITGLKANTTYYVAMKSYVKTSAGTKWSSLSSYATVNVGDYTKTAITSFKAEANSVTLSWTRVPGAAGYRVYNRADGKWVSLKTVTDTSCEVTGLESDTVYNLAIRAYTKVDGATQWYGYGKKTKIITAPSEKDLTGGRYEEFREFLFYSDYSLDFTYYETDGYGAGEWIESKLAIKGDDFYVGEWYEADATDVVYTYSNNRIYIINHDTKQYTYVTGASDEAYGIYLNYLYSTGFFYHENEMKTCIGEFKGQPAVCEYFYDEESSVYVYTYFIADEYVGTELYPSNYSEGELYCVCELKNIDTTPASSLFKVPSGYKYVNAK